MKEETLPTLFIHLKVGVIGCHLMKMEIPQFRHRRRPMAMVGRGGPRNKIHAPLPTNVPIPKDVLTPPLKGGGVKDKNGPR